MLAGAKRAWNADAFALGPTMKVISRIGIGYDNVDVAAATAAGVIVCNAPDAPSVSTAEHTLMLMLAVVKNLPAQTERARQGLPGATTGTALELDGSVLGLVGYGRIARRVGLAAVAMGMSVLAYDPYLDEADGCELVGLDRVFAESHVISLHAPAVAETRHMINADSLATMKRGVYLVNCARGGLVDQDALLAALDSGQVAGAALDVTDPEPLAGRPSVAAAPERHRHPARRLVNRCRATAAVCPCHRQRPQRVGRTAGDHRRRARLMSGVRRPS